MTLLNEVRELSKKKQDGVLNKTKVKIINRLLSKINVILEKEPTSEFLELLDEEVLPTNSDVVIIIVQYKSAMEQFKDKYYVFKGIFKDNWGMSQEEKEWKTED